jgi:asparagine synthase (glutamine-hydrolysing)
MSMAVSLETRVPLLDHRLIEFVATVPSALKLRRGRGKYLLRRLLQPQVPPGVVERPKHGFTAPVGRWLRGPLRDLARDLLLDGRLGARGIFRSHVIADLWHEHQAGTCDHSHRLWSLVMLELWFRQCADPADRRLAGGAAA